MARRFTDDEMDDVGEEDVVSFASPGLAELATFTQEHTHFHHRRDGHLANAMRIEHRKLLGAERRIEYLETATTALAWLCGTLLLVCALLTVVVALR